MYFLHHCWEEACLINVIKELLVTQDAIKKNKFGLITLLPTGSFPSVIFELKSVAALFMTHELF